MYIAICDDNIADRKQLERLLGRESDSRMQSTGVFYIDSFGSSVSLLSSTTIYDAYFCDITCSSPNIYQVATSIREKGTDSPIIICSEIITADLIDKFPKNTYFLQKPIIKSALTKLCNTLIIQKDTNYTKKLAFRNDLTTSYCREEDFLFCTHCAISTIIHLRDGQTFQAIDAIENLWQDFVPFPSLFMPNRKTIANARYVRHIGLFSIIMENGDKIPLYPHLYFPLKSFARKYQYHSL